MNSNLIIDDIKRKIQKSIQKEINREVDKENNNMHFLYGVIIIKL